MSSPFFYRSFVRQYAQEVGVDFEVLAPAVELLAGNMRQPDLPGQGEHQPVRVAPIQPRPKRDFSWVVPTALFVVVVMLGSGGYAAWKYYKPQFSSPTSAVSVVTAVPPTLPAPKAAQASLALPLAKTVNQTHPAAAVPAPAAPQTAQAASEPALPPASTAALDNPTVPSAEAPETAAASAPTDGIHLELAATERTWLSVSADGKQAYTGILEPAETKVLDSQETARIRTGNAGGVTVTFNGKPLGALGPRGTTRTVIFTKSGYEFQPSAEAKLIPANHIGG